MHIRVINPNTTAGMTATIGEAASRIAAPGTRITARQPDHGPVSIKSHFDEAVSAVGVLAFATFPWKLVQPDSADGLQLFVQTYSAFLGPIFAILVVDYYLIRRRTLDLGQLYDAQGPYRGVNPAALVATAVGIAAALTFSSVSWYACLIPAGLTYYLLMKTWAPCQRFCY